MEYVQRYQAISANVIFLMVDRADVQLVATEFARYLERRPMLFLKYELHGMPEHTVGGSANWALDDESGKSTGEGIIMHGQHYNNCWSKTQGLIA